MVCLLTLNHKFSVTFRTHGLGLCEDLFVAVVTASSEIGNIRSSARTPENVSKIHEVAFYSLTSSMWDDLAAAADTLPSPSFAGSGSEPELMSYRENTTNSSPIPPPVFEHPCVPLTKILSSGSFYYASGNHHWDLSTRLQERLARDEWSRREVGLFDERFVWNEYIVRSLLDFRDRLDERERDDFDRCQFVVSFYFVHPCCHNCGALMWRAPTVDVRKEHFLTSFTFSCWPFKDTSESSTLLYLRHRPMESLRSPVCVSSPD